MIRKILLSTLLSINSVAFADVSADSVKVHELKEVVIQAPKVIRKSDMDVYHPSKSAVENSKTACNCLTTL